MILRKLARNHPEDTISDVLWAIFKEKDNGFDIHFAKQFINNINDYTIVDIVRHYPIPGRYKPDITFILRKGIRGKLNFLHIETKLGSRENKYGKGKRNQFLKYTDHMKRSNILSLQRNSILLCPFYNETYNLEHIERYDFTKLINLMENYFSRRNELSIMLIEYLKEEIEGTHWQLKNNYMVEQHPQKFKFYQNMLREIRSILNDIHNNNDTNKHGIWTKNSIQYYFGIGMNKKWAKKERKGYLEYLYYYNDECYSPLVLTFPSELMEKYPVKSPRYVSNNRYCCNLLDDPSLNMLNGFAIKDNQKIRFKKRLESFIEKANDKSNRKYIDMGNKFLNASIAFVDNFSIKISELYETEYRNKLYGDKVKFITRIFIKEDDKKIYLDLVIEPTNPDQNQLLRWESNCQFKGFKKISKEKYYKSLLKKQFNPDEAVNFVNSIK